VISLTTLSSLTTGTTTITIKLEAAPITYFTQLPHTVIYNINICYWVESRRTWVNIDIRLTVILHRNHHDIQIGSERQETRDNTEVNEATGIIDELIQEELARLQEQELTTDITDDLIRKLEAEDTARNRELEEYLNTGILANEEEDYIEPDYDISTPVPGTPHPFETPMNLNRDVYFKNIIADYFDFQENDN
jgi:transcriptional regulator CtsR